MACLPIRAVLTGGPGAGKSTLLDAMAGRGFAVVPEAARSILQAPGGMALRDGDAQAFALAMLDRDIASYRLARPGVSTIFDRGFPDIVGFLRLEGREVPPRLHSACQDLRYEGPIFRAPPWRAIYRRDAERVQTWQEAIKSDRAVTAAWRHYGYEPVDLPLASPEERADFLVNRLTSG